MAIVRVHTPEGHYGVIEPVLRRLLNTGIVTRDPETGAYSAADRAGLEQATQMLGVCDFCDAENPNHVIPTPDFEMNDSLGKPVGTSTGGGWAACDACYELAQNNRRPELLRRAIETAKVGKFGAAGIQMLHEAFWKARDALTESVGIGAAFMDFIDDRLPDVKPSITERSRRVAAVAKLTGMNENEIQALERGEFTYGAVAKKLDAWRKKFGTNYAESAEVAKIFSDTYRPPLPVGHVPHWQTALDMRFKALTELKTLVDLAQSKPYVTPKGTDLGNGDAIKELLQRAQVHKILQQMAFEGDVYLLKRAETYSFNDETIGAIFEAASSIPYDAPLSSVDVPRAGAGWFWFGTPLNVACSPVASERTHALLWGWSENAQVGELLLEDGQLKGFVPTDEKAKPTVMLRFSAYVIDESTDSKLWGHILPSTKWYWPLNMSLHDMLGFNSLEYDRNYGPGGPWEHEPGTVGKDATLKSITSLSLFFMMACLWFKQEVPGKAILAQEPVHIERHARKRYVKEHKLKEPPTVRVVALRKTHRDVVPIEPREGEPKPRDYQYRFTVRGHARLQPCGPQRMDRKLIWISPYIKGPDDKPLRVRDKVFAVIR